MIYKVIIEITSYKIIISSFRFNRDGAATNRRPNIRHLKIIQITRLQKIQTNGNM